MYVVIRGESKLQQAQKIELMSRKRSYLFKGIKSGYQLFVVVITLKLSSKVIPYNAE